MLEIVPIRLDDANNLVDKYHRHHKKVRGHRFSIGLLDESGHLVGAAIVGRPVGREVDQFRILEVTRLVTNGHKNACSMLYSAAARASKELGYSEIQTYILRKELGTSLEASGWQFDGWTKGGNWNHGQRLGTRRQDQPMGCKKRYVKIFKADCRDETGKRI